MITTVRLSADRALPAARPQSLGDLPEALSALRLLRPRPVLALIGGAAGLDSPLDGIFADVVAPVVAACGATAVDGGTDSGVMRLLGRSRSTFPLVGVAAQNTVVYPGNAPTCADPFPLEPHHTHFVLVPGERWGDESAYLARTATLLAGACPALTLLVNGGVVSRRDVANSLAEHRRVLVLTGTGRLADELSGPAARDIGDPSLIEAVDATDRAAVAAALEKALTPPP